MDPIPFLVSTVELPLLADVWVSLSQCCEHGRALPIVHLSCGSMSKVDVPVYSVPINTQDRWEIWPCGHKSKRVVPQPYQLQCLGEWPPIPHMSNIAKLALKVKVWENQPRVLESWRN